MVRGLPHVGPTNPGVDDGVAEQSQSALGLAVGDALLPKKGHPGPVCIRVSGLGRMYDRHS